MQWSRVVGAVVVSLVLGSGGVACGDDSDDGSATGSDVPGQQFDSPWQLVGDVPLAEPLSLAVVDGTAVVVGMEDDGSLGAYYSVDGVEWEPAVGFETLDRPGPGLDMAAGEQGFVAMWSDPLVSDEPMILFSADGSNWEQVPPVDRPTAELAAHAEVVAGSDGFVVVGTGGLRFESTVWFSVDGRTWVETDLEVRNGPLAVANDGDQWMAVGGPAIADYPPRQTRPTDPARVFTSGDGMRWTEIDARDPPSIDTVQEYIGTAFFVADDGTWLLVPAEAGVLGDAPMPWVSTDDGQSWREVAWSDSPEVVGLDEVSGVAIIDDGFVVVGTDGPSTTVAFFSDDAASWELQQPVSSFVGLGALGDDIIALDSDGNVFLRSS